MKSAGKTVIGQDAADLRGRHEHGVGAVRPNPRLDLALPAEIDFAPVDGSGSRNFP